MPGQVDTHTGAGWYTQNISWMHTNVLDENAFEFVLIFKFNS